MYISLKKICKQPRADEHKLAEDRNQVLVNIFILHRQYEEHSRCSVFDKQKFKTSFKVVVLIIFFQIYQIYSKRSAEDIYKILTSYKASYLIVEDAICNEVGTMRGCRVKDLLDIANGHVRNHL